VHWRLRCSGWMDIQDLLIRRCGGHRPVPTRRGTLDVARDLGARSGCPPIAAGAGTRLRGGPAMHHAWSVCCAIPPGRLLRTRGRGGRDWSYVRIEKVRTAGGRAGLHAGRWDDQRSLVAIGRVDLDVRHRCGAGTRRDAGIVDQEHHIAVSTRRKGDQGRSLYGDPRGR